MEAEWMASRLELYRLWQENPAWGARQLAATLERSLSWVKKWLKRFRETEKITGDSFRSQSRRPKKEPKGQHPWVIEAVLSLRVSLSEQYHRKAGARLILYHLHKDPALQNIKALLPRSTKTIYKILKTGGLIQPQKPIIHIPVERPAPLEEWELDFAQTAYWGGENGAEILVTIDRGTSILLQATARSRFHAHSALEGLTQLLLSQGLPQRLRFDRDARLFGSWTRDSYPSPFIRFLRCLGIEPVVCPPRRPDLKPFVERGIRTIKEECLSVLRPDHITLMNSQLDDYRHFYNTDRPHQGLSCQNQPPYTAFPTLPNLPPLPDTVDPDRWLLAYHGRVYFRRVNANGSVMIDRHRYYPGQEHKGKRLAFHLDAYQRVFKVQQDGRVIGEFEIQGLHGSAMPLQTYLKLMMDEARSIEQRRLEHWAKDLRGTTP